MVNRTNLNNVPLQNGSGSLLGLYTVETGSFTEVVQIQYLDMTKKTKVASINFNTVDTGGTLEESGGHYFLYYGRIPEYFHFRINL